MAEAAAAPSGCTGRLTTWATSNLPLVFSILRCLKPILAFKDFAMVTRFPDVVEVLSRDDAFDVTYAEKMKVVGDGSNFFLGMGPTPQYTQDVTNMRMAVRRTDLDGLVVPLVEAAAARIVKESGGKIDAAADLTRVVPAILVEQYIGLPGPTRDELIEWTTSLFYYLFFPGIPEQANQVAIENAALARRHIDKLIAERRAGGEKKDDVLGRLLHMEQADLPPLNDVYIRNNLLGIIIGAIPTTSKCAALVLDYLLDHPPILAEASQVARRGDLATLNKYVLESLRLNAFGPGLFRRCVQDYRVAKGTWRAKTIRKGTSVLVATQSAMLDGREIRRPKRFDASRPAYQYLHYGYGMHTCFGQYINNVQIAAIVKSLLVQNNLRRAAGDAGRLVLDSRTFPSHMQLEFDP